MTRGGGYSDAPTPCLRQQDARGHGAALAFPPRPYYLARTSLAERNPPMPSKRVRVAIVGLGFGAEFIPIYQAHPNAEMYAICRRNKAELDKLRRPLRHQGPLHRLRRAARGPQRRCRPHQLADPRPRPAEPRRPARPASTSPAPCRWPPPSRSASNSSRRSGKSGKVYMMMETVVYSREYLFVKELYDRASWAGFSSCAAATSRTWTAGPTTGPACRRCTTPRTASARAWRSCSRASTPRASSATAPAASARS